MSHTPLNIAALAILALLAAAVLWTLLKRDKMDVSRINLEDLLIGPDGKMSKAAVVMFGAFGLTTWMMVFLTMADKMTEGYLAIYVGAWIAPTVAWIIKGPVATDKP